jgi:protein-tyrosine phosphatase
VARVTAAASSARGTDAFRVLFVCTGNICRSPAAERLARAWLAERAGDGARAFEVASAGTQGLTGHPMDDVAARALVAYGGDPSGFVSRALEPYLVESADLVVGLARRHRAAAVTQVPTATRRTFTLRELAELVTPDGAVDEPPRPGPGSDGPRPGEGVVRGSVPAYARSVVADAAARRGTIRSAAPEEHDVADPIGEGADVHRAVVGQVATCVGRVMAALAGVPGTAGRASS